MDTNIVTIILSSDEEDGKQAYQERMDKGSKRKHGEMLEDEVDMRSRNEEVPDGVENKQFKCNKRETIMWTTDDSMDSYEEISERRAEMAAINAEGRMLNERKDSGEANIVAITTKERMVDEQEIEIAAEVKITDQQDVRMVNEQEIAVAAEENTMDQQDVKMMEKQKIRMDSRREMEDRKKDRDSSLSHYMQLRKGIYLTNNNKARMNDTIEELINAGTWIWDEGEEGDRMVLSDSSIEVVEEEKDGKDRRTKEWVNNNKEIHAAKKDDKLEYENGKWNE